MDLRGKKLKSTAKQQHRWDRFFAIYKKIRFYSSMYRKIWVDVFIKYNISLPSSAAAERLFSMDAAILTAKRPSLKLPTACFFEWKLNLHKTTMMTWLARPVNKEAAGLPTFSILVLSFVFLFR